MGNKIKEVLRDKDFVEKLYAAESLKEASNMLEERGVALSEDQLKQLLELTQKREEGTLTDEELESIAGGIPIMYYGLPEESAQPAKKKKLC